MGRITHTVVAVWRFYRDGFRAMTWGRTLWFIILAKLVVIFVLLRLCFFRPHMAGKDQTEKQDYVGTVLEQRSGGSFID
jgi:uncharacterized membrane protein